MAEQPQDKYVLRLPNGMRDQIKASAEKNGRSMNAEIIDRLQKSFDGGDKNDLTTLLSRALTIAEEHGFGGPQWREFDTKAR